MDDRLGVLKRKEVEELERDNESNNSFLYPEGSESDQWLDALDLLHVLKKLPIVKSVKIEWNFSNEKK